MDWDLKFLWDWQRNPVFWSLLIILVVVVVFLGTKLFLKHFEQVKEQRGRDERQDD